MEQLKDKLKNLSGGKILDIGAGWGGSVEFLTDALSNYVSIVGIDISEEYIERAREALEDSTERDRISYKIMNAQNMKFEDNTFDTVCITNTFHHLYNIPAVLSEMKRVLRPSGLFIFYEMFFEKESEVENSYHHVHHWYADVDKFVGIPHNHTLTKGEIMTHIGSLDLREVEYVLHQKSPVKPNDESGTIEMLIKRCNMFMDKIRNNPDASELIKIGEKHLELIEETGFTPDPVIGAIGYK